MKRRHFLYRSSAAILGSTFILSKGRSLAPFGGLADDEKLLTRSVFGERIAQAQGLMEEQSLDALFMTPSTNMSYLMGRKLWRSERLIALIVPQDGLPEAICPAFEKSLLERDIASQYIHVWEEHENPLSLTRDVLKAMGLGNRATIGLEPTTRYETYERLSFEFPEARLVNASTVFDELRMVKSPVEIRVIRKAARITEESITAVHALLEEGLTELDVAAMLSKEMRVRGSSGGGLVQFGANSAIPHAGSQRKKLRKGMTVLIDAGSRVEGYTSDVTRTIFWGEYPAPKYRQVFSVVLTAQQAAVSLAKPGVPCQELDRAARAIVSKAGFGEYFTHRLGHGMGMDVHERPYLVEGNSRPLERGNVVTIEPGIYLPGEFGVRIEDDFALTENGIEWLSTPVSGG